MKVMASMLMTPGMKRGNGDGAATSAGTRTAAAMAGAAPPSPALDGNLDEEGGGETSGRLHLRQRLFDGRSGC